MKLIPKDLTSDALETLLNSNEQGVFLELSPTNRFGPGMFISFLQVLCSKIRLIKDFEVTTNLEQFNEEFILTNFHKYYYLFSILLFKNDLIIRDRNGFMLRREYLITNSQQQFNLQEELYSFTFDQAYPEDSYLRKIQDMRKRVFSDRSPQKISEGVTFFIASFDHSKVVKNSSYFYNSEGNLRNRDEVSFWISKLFKYNNLNIRTGLERNKTHKEIAVVVKELFDNTEDWAKTSFDNKSLYSPNLRSCFINIYMEERIHNLSFNSENKILNYIQSVVEADDISLQIPGWQLEMYSNFKIGICEISILDTGPGMARRWLKKDYFEFDLEEEKIAVRKCFNKYVTSDISGRSQVRGRGLNSVVRTIGSSGYIQVRTGRLTLSRNFFADKLSQVEAKEGLSFDFDVRSQIEGTSITILYPFLYTR